VLSSTAFFISICIVISEVIKRISKQIDLGPSFSLSRFLGK
jgi:hypothetical protein